MPAATEGGRPGRGRSARKRRVILETATELFLRNGYLGTSMDEVASVAGVSKQTVYKHFADKEPVPGDRARDDRPGREPFYDLVPSLGNVDVEADLRALARGLVAIVMRPQLLQLRRLVIAEAGLSRARARLLRARSGRTAGALAARFEELADRGLLDVPDPLLAGSHFLWLVVSMPLNAVMFGGSETQFTTRQLNRFADAGARVPRGIPTGLTSPSGGHSGFACSLPSRSSSVGLRRFSVSVSFIEAVRTEIAAASSRSSSDSPPLPFRRMRSAASTDAWRSDSPWLTLVSVRASSAQASSSSSSMGTVCHAAGSDTLPAGSCARAY